MASGPNKRASMREGPLAALFRKTEEGAGEEYGPVRGRRHVDGRRVDVRGRRGLPGRGAVTIPVLLHPEIVTIVDDGLHGEVVHGGR